jgi:hypothetical protein
VAHLGAGATNHALADSERAVALLLPAGIADARGPLSTNVADGAAQALTQLSRAYGAGFDFSRALETNELALELRLRMLDRIGPEAGLSLSSGLMRTRSDRAMLLFERGEPAAAWAEVEEAIRLGEAVGRAAGADWTRSDREALGLSHCLRALMAAAAGDSDPSVVAKDLARAESLDVPDERLNYVRDQIAALRSARE